MPNWDSEVFGNLKDHQACLDFWMHEAHKDPEAHKLAADVGLEIPDGTRYQIPYMPL